MCYIVDKLKKRYLGTLMGAFFMAKNTLDKPDQFYQITSDEALQKALISLADGMDEEIRTEVWNLYHDDKLHEAYRSWRKFNSLNKNGMTDKGYQREVIRLHPRIYQFLQDIFEPHYGPKWLQNKKVLRHELVRPWWLVERI